MSPLAATHNNVVKKPNSMGMLLSVLRIPRHRPQKMKMMLSAIVAATSKISVATNSPSIDKSLEPYRRNDTPAHTLAMIPDNPTASAEQ
mmetsp:Transcript_59298/g.94132  ORF Transcript_59298/g.94132 Transcript_59298/m.94132 type:complete len:89 (+) Transcript_59298:573-839(+)